MLGINEIWNESYYPNIFTHFLQFRSLQKTHLMYE
jgi:hypothetical protein